MPDVPLLERLAQLPPVPAAAAVELIQSLAQPHTDPVIGPLFGVDEVLALSIVNVYGSIGLSNFGYLDAVRPAELLQAMPAGPHRVNTFLDDILAAIVAAACARLAHRAADARQGAQGRSPSA